MLLSLLVPESNRSDRPIVFYLKRIIFTLSVKWSNWLACLVQKNYSLSLMNSALRLWCVDFYVNTAGVVVQMGAMLKSLLRLVVKAGRHVPWRAKRGREGHSHKQRGDSEIEVNTYKQDVCRWTSAAAACDWTASIDILPPPCSLCLRSSSSVCASLTTGSSAGSGLTGPHRVCLALASWSGWHGL